MLVSSDSGNEHLLRRWRRELRAVVRVVNNAADGDCLLFALVDQLVQVLGTLNAVIVAVAAMPGVTTIVTGANVHQQLRRAVAHHVDAFRAAAATQQLADDVFDNVVNTDAVREHDGETIAGWPAIVRLVGRDKFYSSVVFDQLVLNVVADLLRRPLVLLQQRAAPMTIELHRPPAAYGAPLVLHRQGDHFVSVVRGTMSPDVVSVVAAAATTSTTATASSASATVTSTSTTTTATSTTTASAVRRVVKSGWIDLNTRQGLQRLVLLSQTPDTDAVGELLREAYCVVTTSERLFDLLGAVQQQLDGGGDWRELRRRVIAHLPTYRRRCDAARLQSVFAAGRATDDSLIAPVSAVWRHRPPKDADRWWRQLGSTIETSSNVDDAALNNLVLSITCDMLQRRIVVLSETAAPRVAGEQLVREPALIIYREAITYRSVVLTTAPREIIAMTQ